MIWFTSDTHFGHQKVIDYCKRPFQDVKLMEEALIENWNKRVKKNEQVYVLGDFAFTGREKMKEILSKLKGQKILVKGNHDKDARSMLEAGFQKVVENERIKIGNTSVLLSHFPYHPVTQHITYGDKVLYHGIDKNVDNRYLHKRIIDDGKTWLIHGHVHQHWKVRERMINVGVDVWDYSPVGHERLLEIINGGRRD